MNRKNLLGLVLALSGLALLTFGTRVKHMGRATSLPDSVADRLLGGPPTGCRHKCGNGSCCNDLDLCKNWHGDQSRCDSTNARYNTNGKADWVCRPKDGYGNCDATQKKVLCAQSKKCIYDTCHDQCEPSETVNKSWVEAMKCTDDDGDHES